MYGDPETMESFGSFEYDDFEDEFEAYGDFEDEYEGLDFEYEYEDEFDRLLEASDYEGDLFLGDIVRSISSVARRVPWQRLLSTGASALLSNLEDEGETLGEMAYMAELAAETESEEEADQFLGVIGSLASTLLPALLGEEEGVGYEEEWASYEYEDEADEFLPALLPIASMILPAVMPAIKRGIQTIGKALRETDPTKQSVKVLPIVAAKTVASLARQAQAGKKITQKRVNATLAHQAKKTLSSPKQVAKAIAINRKVATKAAQKAKQKKRVTKQLLRRKRLMRAQ